MANGLPSRSSGSALDRVSTGPKLMGAGVALFVVTRIIKWLPLGFLGSWINGLLWPVLLIALVVGGFLTYRQSQRS